MDTSTQQILVITAWVVMTVLAAFTVRLRFYTRCIILRILGPEDWLILVAMVCNRLGSTAPEAMLNLSTFRCCQWEPAWASSAVSKRPDRALPTSGSKLTSSRNLLWPGTTHIWTASPENMKKWGMVWQFSTTLRPLLLYPDALTPLPWYRNGSTASFSTP